MVVYKTLSAAGLSPVAQLLQSQDSNIPLHEFVVGRQIQCHVCCLLTRYMHPIDLYGVQMAQYYNVCTTTDITCECTSSVISGHHIPYKYMHIQRTL